MSHWTRIHPSSPRSPITRPRPGGGPSWGARAQTGQGPRARAARLPRVAVTPHTALSRPAGAQLTASPATEHQQQAGSRPLGERRVGTSPALAPCSLAPRSRTDTWTSSSASPSPALRVPASRVNKGKLLGVCRPLRDTQVSEVTGRPCSSGRLTAPRRDEDAPGPQAGEHCHQPAVTAVTQAPAP